MSTGTGRRTGFLSIVLAIVAFAIGAFVYWLIK